MTMGRLALAFVLCVPLWLRLFLGLEKLDGAWSLIAGPILPVAGLIAALIAVGLRRRLDPRLALSIAAFNLAVTVEDIAVGGMGPDEGWPVLTWNLADAAGYPSQMDCAVSTLSKQPRGFWAFQEMSREETKVLEARLRLQCLHLEYHDRGSRNGPALCVPAEDGWVVQSGYAHKMTGDAVNRYLFAEVIPPQGPVINVANVHLQSYWGSRASDEPQGKGLFSQLTSARKRLQKMARRQRAQVTRITQRYGGMKDPLLLLGDFNSTANVWIHHHLRQTFQDAHRQRGWGLGGSRPVAALGQRVGPRVDYLYASPGLRWSGETQTIKGSEACSDHRAVRSWLSLDQPRSRRP
ncbi:MAG: hypothetical protein CMH55_03310 [Myxococcales bacterium]|nr:hypothetical protein [Myxococcales bacterium]